MTYRLRQHLSYWYELCWNLLHNYDGPRNWIIWIFFFFSRRYNPWWVLACFTILFHNLLSLHFSLQPSQSWSSYWSWWTWFPFSEFLTVLVVSIRITCAAQRNLCDFINLTIFFFLISLSNSSFVFILHVPSLSSVGPYIFLVILFSKTSRWFCSVTVMAHVSQPYVTVGRTYL